MKWLAVLFLVSACSHGNLVSVDEGIWYRDEHYGLLYCEPKQPRPTCSQPTLVKTPERDVVR